MENPLTNVGRILTGKLGQGTPGSVGKDIYSGENTIVPAGGDNIISTNLRIAVPKDCAGFIWSRSGLSCKNMIEAFLKREGDEETPGAGLIDPDYRGEVKVHLYNHSDKDFVIEEGDRIAQLITIPVNVSEYVIQEPYVQVDSLEETERGEGGFGSTGTK